MSTGWLDGVTETIDLVQYYVQVTCTPRSI